MQSTQRTIVATASIFGIAAVLLASIGFLPPKAAESEPIKTLMKQADDLLPHPVDFDKLLKWDFETDAGISTEVEMQRSVRKIAYGRMSDVQVYETSSGIYSSDALGDPHIQYPGINRLNRGGHGGLAFWGSSGWVLLQPYSAGSFTSIQRFDGGGLVTRNGRSCVYTRSSVSCS